MKAFIDQDLHQRIRAVNVSRTTPHIDLRRSVFWDALGAAIVILVPLLAYAVLA